MPLWINLRVLGSRRQCLHSGTARFMIVITIKRQFGSIIEFDRSVPTTVPNDRDARSTVFRRCPPRKPKSKSWNVAAALTNFQGETMCHA